MEKSDYITPVEADTRYKDFDMGTKAQEFYNMHFPEAIKCERGETWFTPISVLEELRRVKKINTLLTEEDKIKKNYKGVVKEFKSEIVSQISNIHIKEKDSNYYPINRAYHSLVNFGCIPSKLNSWKGFRNRSRLGDFPDLFLACIKSYLTGIQESGYVLEREGKELQKFEWWFIKIGNGKKCTWEEFVDKMKLRGSFVDKEYNIVYLFNHKIGKPFPNLQYIIENKPIDGYTRELLVHQLCESKEIIHCINTIYEIWENRATELQTNTN